MLLIINENLFKEKKKNKVKILNKKIKKIIYFLLFNPFI